MPIDKETHTALRNSPFGKLPVSRVMESTVRSENKEASAQLIASILMEGFGSVPIVDKEHNLIGLVSEFDLLNTIRQGKALADVMAQDIMTLHPLSVTEGTDMCAAIEILQNNHLIRVPVITPQGKLIGIVARRDILRGYLHSQS